MSVCPSRPSTAERHAYTGRPWNHHHSASNTTKPASRDVRVVGAGNFAGHEIDFTVRWKASEHLTIDAGYSHFFAGDYLRDTGPHDDADFAYVQATLSF